MRLFLVLILGFSLPACGWLYTDTVTPLCTNMKGTHIGEQSSRSKMKEISIPRLPGARLRWSSKAIGDAAREQGIEEIYYCDLKVFRVLGGIWGSEAVVVYGR